MKKVVLCVICILLVLVLIVVLNPLRRSVNRIRENILETIPVGTDMDSAITMIKKKGWEIRWINEDVGFGISDDGKPGEGYGKRVGTKHIRIGLGYYGFIFETYVVAYLGFDTDSKLVGVAVRKDIDVL